MGAALLLGVAVHAAPVHLVDEKPVEITKDASGVYIVDFGKVAFGNVRLLPPDGARGEVIVHFGEDFVEGRVNRTPEGTVRYNKTTVALRGKAPVVAAPPPDERNTSQVSVIRANPAAILTPPEWGVVLPFRWLEVEGWSGELLPEQIVRQAAFASTWDDDAAMFECSDEMLNRIWEFCRYSIKATTFAGLYVDGDRERIPYEADAYLNQLSHYTTDTDIQMARDTYDHLMINGTWPTEWGPHMIFMAHADWMHTGDADWLAPRYEALKGKLLLKRIGPDGLIVSDKGQINKYDIVDWPPMERDAYVMTPVNTVVNAFHLRSLELMAGLAEAVGRENDALLFRAMWKTTLGTFNEKLLDPKTGLYIDGIGTDHSAMHANFFPLAFGLVPDGARDGIVQWLAGKGMGCSVYGAQYFLDALFENGADAAALELIAAEGDRSWRHMVESGATISWEAWDLKYKPNQDWNHAWGAAPANLLPRHVLGVQPFEPGWNTVRIRPMCGNLSEATGKVPTPRGPVWVTWECAKKFRIGIAVPDGVRARLELPAVEGSTGVFQRKDPVKATKVGDRWILDEPVTGRIALEVR
ncbi:hypothetical protein PDESU_05269 [Pontiella desulfatans]|uniref:alpha-L-rhamnosidase n=1 Tax=Pontiella desulfatans TaxID=2750659 RepID=A0A6C2U9A0_PONDE|nr:alpha-L-rhamnosidase C-terminal domain-containing protein [Pontiella desulfatans]VGO16678.1 hypothetical protein PDESU_05269 [Pontiella desulfatans]